MIALNKTNRNYFMGIAIVLVILHHFCLRLDGCWHVDTFPFTIFYWGQIGVDIFLFVSAYGCCASWENNSWWQYALHRIKRIYPQYIVFLLIVLLWFFADASILHRMKMAVFSLMGIAPIYRLGVSIEWYIPSLLMMYFFLPLIYMGIKHANRGGQLLLISVAILSLPGLLERPWIYYPFLARIPVILCGIVAYINRKDLAFLAKMFAFLMLLGLTTRENMVIHSMMVPLFFVALSMIELGKLPLQNMFTFLGKHSLEIFFAQTITTQYMMKNYYWGEKWLSLAIIIGITILLALLFYLVQVGFDWLYTKVTMNVHKKT